MKDALTILLQDGPLDAASESLLCEELALTYNQVESLKLSEKHESLLEKIEALLKNRAKD